MENQVLQKIATFAFPNSFELHDDTCTYLGTAIPLQGNGVVVVSLKNIEATITNRDSDWLSRMVALEGSSGFVNPGEFFRPVTPGVLIYKEHYGEIVPSQANWEAHMVLYQNQSSHSTPTSHVDTYNFDVQTLVVKGQAFDSVPSATRAIYAFGEIAANCSFQDQPMLLRSIGQNRGSGSVSSSTLAVTFDWVPTSMHLDAVWNGLSFVSGQTLRYIGSEFYDTHGELIKREHAASSHSRNTVQRFFNPYEKRLTSHGISRICDGFYKLLAANFPIEVIVQHLLMAHGSSIDVNAQHLILAIHTAIESWNKKFGKEHWIDSVIWKTFAGHIRGEIAPDLYDSVGPEVSENIRAALSLANRTTTAWRQSQLFERLQIDVSNEDDKRALKLRNELLHNGYFLERFETLSKIDLQTRIEDVERLRRLTLIIIFKLVGYQGSFVDPVSLNSLDVEPVLLPPEIA